MLITIFSWIPIFYIANSFGIIGQSLIQNISGEKLESNTLSLWINIVIGLSLISVILSILSFFYPISNVILAALFILSLFKLKSTLQFLKAKYFSLTKINKSKDWLWLLISFFYFLLIIIQSVKEPFVTDTGLYHAQTIKWFETFKVVKGIGNLHGRLAFNSSFHLICAVFGFSFVKAATLYNTVQSFLLLFLGFYLLKNIRQERKPPIRFVYSATLLLIVIFYRDWVSSPSPDIPATIFIVSGFFYFMEVMNKIKLAWNDFYTITLICIVVITIKVSSVPVALLPLIFLIRKWHQSHIISIKPILISFSFVAIAMIPWLIRNVIMSGYLVYPLPSVNIFDVFWKVPIEYAIREKEWVHVFARIGSYDLDRYAQLTSFEWFTLWFFKRTIVEKVIFICLCLSPFIFLIKLIRDKFRLNVMMRTYLASFPGVVFWFVMAPYFRFGHGFIIVAFLISIVLLLEKFSKILSYVAVIICFTFIIYSVPKEMGELKGKWKTVIVYPQPYPKDNDTFTIIFKSQKFYVTEDQSLCWDCPLPCTPEMLPGLQLIGNNIDEGFYIENPSKKF
jgi:hypothetical protein